MRLARVYLCFLMRDDSFLFLYVTPTFCCRWLQYYPHLHLLLFHHPFSIMPVPKVSLSGLDIIVTIAQGRNLVAKDRALLSRRRTTSDPYVKVSLGDPSGPTALIGETAVISKNCENPVWNATFRKSCTADEARRYLSSSFSSLLVWCVIYDSDGVSADDPMGVVPFPLLTTENQDELVWYPVTPGPSGHPQLHCHNATGELQVRVRVQGRPVRDLARGTQLSIHPSAVRIGLAWDVQQAGGAVDLDAAVVAVDRSGKVDARETVYYGNLHNPNRSIAHSGDDTTGHGGGDDETVLVNLQQVPSHIIALYLLLTVATPGKTLGQVTSAVVQVTDTTTHEALCRSMPAQEAASSQENTALVMLRMSRTKNDATTHDEQWLLTPIQEGFPYARDWGSLIPELKGYTRDLIPNISIDPTERMALLRKGGVVRVTDYLPGHKVPTWLTFGLAWDVTDGVNIDLDASAILLDGDLNDVDTVWFRHLQSKDGSIQHSGDEREGDEAGDDEKIKVNLNRVSKNVRYIGFVLNSFSGQELDDVSKASCHLFDAETYVEVAKYSLTDTHELDKHTALLVACLFREQDGDDWRLWILSQPRQGKTVQDNIPDMVDYLRNHTAPAVTPSIGVEDEDEIVVAMPSEMETYQEEDEIAVLPMEDLLQHGNAATRT